MMEFKPADGIEGMMAAQAVAMHHAVMECSRRAMSPDQPYEAAQGHRKAVANSSRAFIALLDALDRKRGKNGQQKVTVEHVHVHAGGKALVGNIAPGAAGGGFDERSAGEPHAPGDQLEHEPDLSPAVPFAAQRPVARTHAKARRCRMGDAGCTAANRRDRGQLKARSGSAMSGYATGNTPTR